jgi:8-oxo-dGTP diphosphatase
MVYQNEKIWVSIDSLVLGYDPVEEAMKILLFKRKVAPFSGEWSLIGGFINENEDLIAAAKRLLNEFTGLNDVFLEQLRTFGKSSRDPGGRVVSVLYCSLIKLDDFHKNTVNTHGARWFGLDELPNLVMDHAEMLQLGIEQLKKNAVISPIGFELLPHRFTLPQLLRLYEAIYGRTIDDRNFRKKILATDILKRLEEKDKTNSKKGAYLYEFDLTKYQQLKGHGFHLEFAI